jgi:hypothetical protein
MPIVKVTSIDPITANSIVLTPPTAVKSRFAAGRHFPALRIMPRHRFMLFALGPFTHSPDKSFDKRRRQ